MVVIIILSAVFLLVYLRHSVRYIVYSGWIDSLRKMDFTQIIIIDLYYHFLNFDSILFLGTNVIR